MIRFMLSTWTVAFGWGWWVIAPKSGVTRVVVLLILTASTTALALMMQARSRRLRGDHEYVTARLEYHSGFSRARWRRTDTSRGDDGGSELSLGGW